LDFSFDWNDVIPLKNNNFVIVSHGYEEVGENTEGSIRLINSDTGAQIGPALPGPPNPEDGVLLSVDILDNGNFLMVYYLDDVNAYLAQLVNGFTGIPIGPRHYSGRWMSPVALSNSNFVVRTQSDGDDISINLISGITGTQIGAVVVEGIEIADLIETTALNNGNFAIHSPQIGGGNKVQLVSGFTGNQIGATLLLPGINGGHAIDTNITVLENGNFVITSFDKDSGFVQLINGTTGVQIGTTLTGEASNTLYYGLDVIPLANNNFVVMSNSTVELINGFTGTQIGTALASNVGAAVVPGGVTPLANSNFVIVSTFDASVRLINGATNVQIGATLAGYTENDRSRVRAFTNSNFVIISEKDDVGGIVDAGSVRLVNGNTGMQMYLKVGSVPEELLFANMVYLATGDFYILGLPFVDNNGLENSGEVLLIPSP